MVAWGPLCLLARGNTTAWLHTGDVCWEGCYLMRVSVLLPLLCVRTQAPLLAHEYRQRGLSPRTVLTIHNIAFQVRGGFYGGPKLSSLLLTSSVCTGCSVALCSSSLHTCTPRCDQLVALRALTSTHNASCVGGWFGVVTGLDDA
jgi:hypothetical protein